MRNEGVPPPYETVDLKLRNGWIIRGANPKQWRWARFPHGQETDGDIVAFNGIGERIEDK